MSRQKYINDYWHGININYILHLAYQTFFWFSIIRRLLFVCFKWNRNNHKFIFCHRWYYVFLSRLLRISLCEVLISQKKNNNNNRIISILFWCFSFFSILFFILFYYLMHFMCTNQNVSPQWNLICKCLLPLIGMDRRWKWLLN